MHLNSIRIQQYGPIGDLNIVADIPKSEILRPIILVGPNGSGKSILLANILDALIELKRKHFSEIPEVDEQKLFKLGKKDYVHARTEFSLVEIEFSHKEIKGTYLDFVSRVSHDRLPALLSERGIKGVNLSESNLTEHGF